MADPLEEDWRLESIAAEELEATTRSPGERARAHRLWLMLNELRPNDFSDDSELGHFLDGCHTTAVDEAATIAALAKTKPRQAILDQDGVGFPSTWADKIYADFHVSVDLPALWELYQSARKDALRVVTGIVEEVWARGLPLTLDQARNLGDDEVIRLVLPFSRVTDAAQEVTNQFARAMLQWMRTNHHWAFAKYYQEQVQLTSGAVRRGDDVVDHKYYELTERFSRQYLAMLQKYADAAATPQDLAAAFNALDVQIRNGKFYDPYLGHMTYSWPTDGLDAFWAQIRQVDAKVAGASFNDSTARAFMWAFERDFFTASGLQVWESIKENGWKILATAVAIIIAQFIPGVDVALDIILMIEFGLDAISTVIELAGVFKDCGTAKSVTAMEHASARLAETLTGTAVKILLWAMAWGAGKLAGRVAKWREGKKFIERNGNSAEAREALAQHKGDVAKAERTLAEQQRLRAERAAAEAERAREAAAGAAKPTETLPPTTPPPPTPSSPKGPEPPTKPPTPPKPPKTGKPEPAPEPPSVTAQLRALKGKAKEAEWVSPKQGQQGSGLRDHFDKHGAEVGAGSVREYDLSARKTIQNGRRFRYRDRSSNDPRVGYWDPETGLFTATSETRGVPAILSHFPETWERLRDLPGFTGR